MKTVKKITFISILVVGMTSSVFASWWNPLTWFNKKTETTKNIIQTKPEPKKEVPQQPATSTNNENQKPRAVVKEKDKVVLEQKNQTPPQKTKTDQSPQSPATNVPNTISANTAPSTLLANATLKLSVDSGGNVFSQENKISCYSDETCDYVLPTKKKIILRAVAAPGYSFEGWSEASCGKLAECTVTLFENMTVKAYFEVPKPAKITGKILHPQEGSTCFIPLGEEKCQVALMWQSNVGISMTVKADWTEYYVTIEPDDMFPKLSGVDPAAIVQAKNENADGLIYFPFFAGDHKLTILHRTEVMDSTNFKVACAEGLYWDGRRCWEKDAKLLHVFKDQHAVVISEPAGISCGYRPDQCMAGFSNGTKVTLTVKVDAGYVFDGWSGSCSGKESTCTFIMNENKSVGIKFK